jgi:hypothetical protein
MVLSHVSLKVLFWWKSHLKLLDKFKGLGRCKIGDDKSALLWTDNWEEECLLHKLPHLASFAKRKDITVFEGINTFLEDLFHLPMTSEAFAEFEELEEICIKTQITMQAGNTDNWSYIWGSDTFTVKNTYKTLIGTEIAPAHFS